MIRSALLFLIALISISSGFAQQFIKRTKKITHEVTEKYTAIIGTDREIKQGNYYAFYNKKIPVAVGKYASDKRIGMWHFFNKRGEPIQNYDYDTNTLRYEASDDTIATINYGIDHGIAQTDVVTKPVKPGGRYYGYLPYLKCFKLPGDMEGENLNMYYATLEILVSPLGRLAEYKIQIKAKWDNDYDRVINVNISRLYDDDKTFIPATLNGVPIASRISIYCYFTTFDTIDLK